ncbi:glycosyltransferase [Tropicimonas isoalkanivorans]|uniref:Glycosyl transferases group 1 n=1 Tax=Tropicimonas isoalkanivorans TaxID=441112 RepID=A0A1I1E2Z3_9RHOB|nr:glycosyltransferase [Tropicimonas isoalkanivorans]SFB81052.1 Glycosyl transferases group 1 [Tropicimonas isoalkanivorans]
MRILYITRDRSGRSLRKRLHRWSVGFLDGQDGFFEAALHEAGRVQRMSYAEAMALPAKRSAAFDAVVINAKSGWPWQRDPGEAAAALRRFPQPVSLFLGHAQPDAMPPDSLVTPFKVVFKREPFADLDRYGLGQSNAAKIVPTHLANPMVSHSYRLAWRNRTRPLRRYAWQVPDEHDVFFIGTVSETRCTERVAAWQAVLGADVKSIGGLLPAKGFEPHVPPDLLGRPIPRSDYLKVMMSSRINLALEGIGPFTFRHLEQFWAGAFTLSTPNIRPLRLRAPLVDGQDYVAFDDPDDMMDKIRWYLNHPEERAEIARNGRAAYERLYDVPAHAREIRAALSA